MMGGTIIWNHWQTSVFMAGTAVLIVLSAGCLQSSAVPQSVPYPRIICLSSDTAELLTIIGAGDHVVGVPDSLIRHQPELFARLPNARNIGDAKIPDNERVIALKPDYVFYISAMKPSAVDAWESTGIRVVAVESHKAEDLPDAARRLGILTGHDARAGEYAAFCEQILALIRERIGHVSDDTRPNVYFESYTDYVAYGNVSAASSLAGLLQVNSISDRAFSNATRVSPEWIVRQNPEVIIKSFIPDGTRTLESEHAALMTREGFMEMDAAKNGRVYVVSGNLIFSPHAPVGAIFLAKALYPEQFSDLDPEEILKTYSAKFTPGTEQQPTIYPNPWI